MTTRQMRAAACTRYGGPETVRIVARPVPEPGKDDILIRVLASTVSSGDARLRAMNLPPGMGLIGRLAFGIRGPRNPVLGAELLGEVAGLGPAVTGWQMGQRVVAATGMRMGAHAEYVCLPASGAIAPAPEGLSDDEAAALSFGGTAAHYALTDWADLQAGERLLVIGAGGAVGSAAVQIAHARGATVWAGARRERHAALLGAGADHVFDRRQADFDTLGQRFDVILDTAGGVPLDRLRRHLAPGGRLVLLAAGTVQMLMPLANRWRSHRILAGPIPDRRADLQAVAALAGAGQFRPLVDSVFPLEQVARAHARVDSREKFGSVVLRIAPDQATSDTAPAVSTRSASAGAMPSNSPR